MRITKADHNNRHIPMRLFIAEKPSLGRAIADVLPRPHTRGDGYIKASNGDCISWCIGHVLEQAQPDTYNTVYKRWRFEDLPIIPLQWKLQPKSNTKKQLLTLKKLIQDADELIHAGDPDREGQLLVDELIDFVCKTPSTRKPVQRCLISDLNPSAVRLAIQKLKPNSDFAALSTSALARARADWLYGINLTRAYTLQGRKVSYQGVLSVGRVQTPVLGLVARRDIIIRDFVSKPFYEVMAHLKTQAGDHFTAKWKPSEACAKYQDEEGRVLSKKLAENVVSRISGQNGIISDVSQKRKKEAPPLPYHLSGLQIDSSRSFGLTAQEVLDICQRLYEQHKLITYPRSDCQYLPEGHWQQASHITQAIASTLPSLQTAAQNADTSLRSKAWNDKKVDAHHAIIPTSKHASTAQLSGKEAQVYELIARRYLFQFYPHYEYQESRIQVTISGGQFFTQTRTPLVEGWKVLQYRAKQRSQQHSQKQPAKNTSSSATAPDQFQILPPVKKGETVLCEKGELLEKQTQPPLPYSDASLLSAMTGIARYVQDSAIRKILRETDGLGTEATRAGMIELLIKRGFLERQGRTIRASATGIGFINSLPEAISLPDMTANWEAKLSTMAHQPSAETRGYQTLYKEFMSELENSLHQLVQQSQQYLPTALKGLSSPQPHYQKRKAKSTVKARTKNKK